MTSVTAPRSDLPARGSSDGHVGYRLVIEPLGRRVRGLCGGRVIVDSADALVMYETRYPPVWYFPRADVDQSCLADSEHLTHCPFKGNASYRTLRVGERSVDNAVWIYPEPFDEAIAVKDRMAFYWDTLDEWRLDDETVAEPPPSPYAESSANPFIDWLINDAWKADSAESLLTRFAAQLIDLGVPASRLRLLIQTLHPQLFALTYTWHRERDGIEVFEAEHTGIHSAQFRDSPFAVVLRGEGGVRRRLDIDRPRLDYPILKDLLEQGATDYVAMPLTFSDGQINSVTLVSDQPGGFSIEQLGHLYEILPGLGRHLEAYAQRATCAALLKTYLGQQAGARVMDGLVKRGDGEDLHAAILFADLRDSTALALGLGREPYLTAINQFFDAIAGTVMDHGGEVLKFIGDAVLAIFPIDDPDAARPPACERALTAARAAHAALERINDRRSDDDLGALRCGIALHRGDLTYGNVGSERRLDFTVIGSAVNLAARLEGLCKKLDQPLLMSSAFADSTPRRVRRCGRHRLKGIDQPQQVFAVDDGPVAG